MSKFYQHVEPGDMQGKITRLKYIDDISDDELILYYFEDGTKCSSEYIGGTDETEDTIKSKVMVELTGPDNPWNFMKKEVIAETTKRVRNEVTGEYFEVVGPDVELDGAPGSQNRGIKKMGNNTSRIEITLPRKMSRYRREDDELYMLSGHPELETGNTVNEIPKPAVTKPVIKHVEPIETRFKSTDETIEEVCEEVVTEPDTVSQRVLKQTRDGVYVPKEETFKQEQFYVIRKSDCKDKLFVDLNAISKETDALVFDLDGETYGVSVEELIGLIKNKDKVQEEPKPDFQEDALIKNMIDKSRKKVCSISMNLKLELPPKEVYDTIKTVYPDGMTDEFVRSLTARIPIQSLKDSLSVGLGVYYNGPEKKQEPKKEKQSVDFNTKA